MNTTVQTLDTSEKKIVSFKTNIVSRKLYEYGHLKK